MAIIARGQITIAFVDDGIGIASVDTYYYLSTSSTTLAGGSWSITAPTWGNGKYMWMKTKITYTDSTYKESVAVCITGQQGSTGKGVSNIITEYYLSSSQSTQTGGSWSVTPPTNLTGRYLWTRTKVTYTDNTISYTTPICDSRLNDMEQQIETVIKKQASIDTTLADITLQASETIEKLYQYSAGYGNIFDNCAQVISKDSSLKTEISLSNMVPVSGLDYSKIQGKDICISVNISAKKAIPKTLNNYMGAYFTVTYSDNTIKKYMTAFWPGVRYLEQQLALNTTSMFQRIYNVYTLENKAIKSISNLTLVISCNGEELKVSDPKVEVGSIPTGNDIETKQLIERMNKAELKISPEAITQAVSKQLAEGGELRTTKYVFDVDGAHYYDGGIDISNKAGEKVFYVDVNGNLTLKKISAIEGKFSGEVESLKGKIGNWELTEAGLKSTYIRNIPNYTDTDRLRIKKHILGEITLSASEIDYLDLSWDGIITSMDYVLMGNLLNGKFAHTWAYTYTINPSRPDRFITCQIDRGNNQVSTDVVSIPCVSNNAIKELETRIRKLENK